HHEDERLAGLDRAAGAPVAIAQVRRDDELAPTADLHAGHALVPARDDPAAAEREAEGLAAVPAGVELLTGAERHADVVHGHDLARLGLGALAHPDVPDLQLGRRLAAREVHQRLLDAQRSLPFTSV